MIENCVQNCIQRLEKERIPIEGICVMDDTGRIVCEQRWTHDIVRNIYSNTKSYTSLAVGMAVSNGLLSLNSRLVDSFPDCVPENPGAGLEQITLRDLLTMSSGFHTGLLMEPARRNGIGAPDYVRYMLSQPVLRKPGSEYFYSTGDSILAARMCEAATGEGLPYFLYKHFFSKADIPYPIWDHCPMGHACGGGGLYLRLTDMMKLGVLCLNEGRWAGEQLIDQTWIKEATTKQIDIHNQNVWEAGYGYQFKIMSYHDAFYADGAFGQETIILPKHGLVLGIHCPETEQGMDGAKELKTVVYEEILCKL